MRKTAASRQSSNVIDARIPVMKQRMGYTSASSGIGAKAPRPTKMDSMVSKMKKSFDVQKTVGDQFKSSVMKSAIQRNTQKRGWNEMAATVDAALRKYPANGR